LALTGPARGAGEKPSWDKKSDEEVLRERRAISDSLLLKESTQIDTAGISRLVRELEREGNATLDSILSAQDKVSFPQLSVRPFSMTSYNKVEGVRLGFGFGATLKPGIKTLAAGAYGFSNHRWSGEGSASIGNGEGFGGEIQIENRVVPFGPNRLVSSSGLQALVAGQDRQDYLHRKRLALTLWPLRSRNAIVWLSGSHREESTVASTTDYSFFDGSPIEAPNPQIDPGTTRAAALGSSLNHRGDLVSITLETGIAGGGLGGDFGFSWRLGSLTLRPVFPDGGILNLSVEGLDVGGSAPVQARAFLGGDGNLRGYRHLEFVGKRRLSARIEYEIGIDLLGITGVGLLKAMRLQLVPFTDLGTTWGQVEGVERTQGTLGGSVRSSSGIGLKRDIWLPGIQSVRLDIIRRNDGSPDPLGFWFRLIPFRD
jgi:hypothetical protein